MHLIHAGPHYFICVSVSNKLSTMLDLIFLQWMLSTTAGVGVYLQIAIGAGFCPHLVSNQLLLIQSFTLARQSTTFAWCQRTGDTIFMNLLSVICIGVMVSMTLGVSITHTTWILEDLEWVLVECCWTQPSGINENDLWCRGLGYCFHFSWCRTSLNLFWLQMFSCVLNVF